MVVVTDNVTFFNSFAELFMNKKFSDIKISDIKNFVGTKAQQSTALYRKVKKLLA